jgi:PAS domain S-box-containing protein
LINQNQTMDNQKTREKLIQEINDLNRRYDHLKSSYEKDISARFDAESRLIKRSDLLSALNQYSLELGEQDKETILNYIAFKFKNIFKVRGVWVSSYDETSSEFVIETSTSTDRENSRILKYMGEAIKNHRTFVDKDRYRLMVETGVAVFSSLHDISFGQIPDLIGKAIERIFNVDWFLGIALVDRGKLYGNLVVAGCKGQEELDYDIVKIFAEMTSNILRRKDAELRLQLSEEKYRLLAENISDVIWIMDTDTMYFTYISPSVERLRGYTVEEIIARPVNDALTKETAEYITRQTRERADNILSGKEAPGSFYISEVQQPCKDGSMVWTEVITTFRLNKKGRVEVLGVTRDITKRKKAEDEVNTLNAELEKRVNERTEQLEAANTELQAFAYSVSHDLRAPLRAIDGFSRFILEDYSSKLDAEGQRFLGLIRSNTQKMDKLITDILLLSRITRGEQNKSDIDMTKMAVSMFNETVSSENEDKVCFSIDNLPGVFADPIYIKQVWVNLLSNAIKFSSLCEAPEIKIGGYTEDGFNIYYVQDNGVGFNQEYAHKLFGVFQRLHKSDEFEGTGVGLAIVQRIVHRHGGKVWSTGIEGQGAVFYFSLPVNE